MWPLIPQKMFIGKSKDVNRTNEQFLSDVCGEDKQLKMQLNY